MLPGKQTHMPGHQTIQLYLYRQQALHHLTFYEKYQALIQIVAKCAMLLITSESDPASIIAYVNKRSGKSDSLSL